MGTVRLTPSSQYLTSPRIRAFVQAFSVIIIGNRFVGVETSERYLAGHTIAKTASTSLKRLPPIMITPTLHTSACCTGMVQPLLI